MYHALVAEDEVLIREILCDELTDAGLGVQAFASAEEALALIEGGAPIDLLFTDINLSGAMTGWDLGLKAIAIHPGLRVIYATGGSEPPRALSPLERRIMKPFRFTAIVEMLQDLDWPQPDAVTCVLTAVSVGLPHVALACGVRL